MIDNEGKNNLFFYKNARYYILYTYMCNSCYIEM